MITMAKPVPERKIAAAGHHETEYQVIHQQRMGVIRSYNLWYAFAHLIAHSYFWLLLNLSLTLSSQPLMIATALTASLMIWFAYRVVLTIDRGVVSLYPAHHFSGTHARL